MVQKEIQMPSPEARRQKPQQQEEPKTVQVVRLNVPRYNWNAISQENRARIERGDKLIETSEVDELNAIEAEREYYLDHWSETRGRFRLARRENLKRGAV